MKRIVIIIGLLVASASATERWVAQTAGTFTGGAACNGQTAITLATWNGLTLSAGDITWVCGTITGGAGANGFQFNQSGTSGNPIILNFDAGAVLTSPHWGTGSAFYPSGGAVQINSNYVTVDGQGVGIIKNTLAGSPGTSCPGGSCTFNGTTAGVFVSSTSHNIEIKNLTTQSIYLCNGAAVCENAGGAFSASVFVGTSFSGNNLSIHDNKFGDSGAGIFTEFSGGAISAISIYNNTITGPFWGVALGSGAAGNSTTGVNIYSNTISGCTAWAGDYNEGGAGNGPHCDGVIFYCTMGSTCPANIYSNYITESGAVTADIYCTNGGGSSGSGSQCTVFNNVLYIDNYSGAGVGGGWAAAMGGSTGPHGIYNNTFVGVNNTVTNQLLVLGQGTTNTMKNNLYTTNHYAVYNYAGTNFGDVLASDYNLYYNLNALPFFNGTSAISYASWQGLGFDAHGVTGNPLLNGSYQPQTGSAAIGAGTNLTSLGIPALDSDKAGNSRPSVGAWDIGAYNAAAGVNCGPPGVSSNQSCFNTSTSPVPLPNPIPSWGPNTACVNAAGGNPYALQLCGNLTGAGTSATPTDFGFTLILCTDSTSFGGPLWGFADSGAGNLFASDDSAILIKQNGGAKNLFHIDANGVCTPAPGVTYSKAVFAYTSPTTIFALQGTNQTQLYQDTISISCSGTCTSTIVSHTLLTDFATSNCLLNSYNGNPSWGGGGSVGIFIQSADDTTFTVAYSDTGVTGQKMRWAASWRLSYGSGKCDLWDANSGTIQLNNGTNSAAIITPAYHAGDKVYLHEGQMTLSNGYAIMGPQSAIYGGGVNNFIWQLGTLNINTCGYPVPQPITGSSVIGTLTSGTPVSGETFTQTGTGASAVIGTPIVADATHPLVLGTITGSPNSSGTWIGGVSGAVFTPTSLPALNATTNYFCDGHGANGYTLATSGKNAITHLFTNPSTPLTATAPNSAPCTDQHPTLNFQNLVDAYPTLITAQDNNDFGNLATIQLVGSNTVCTGSPSFVGIPLYFDELYYSNVGTGNVLRLAHTFKSGWSWTFDGQSGGGAIQSSSGKLVAFLTDGWGQFGSTNGAAQCNIGGPDWNKSDSTHFTTGTGYGSFILPVSGGNSGHYVYHVKSCSGTCTTGTVPPVWPQTTTPHTTVVDNTITWETTPDAANSAISAINNCRLEVMLVKTTQGTNPPPPPPPPAPATNLFVKSAKLGDAHEETAAYHDSAHRLGAGTAFQYVDLDMDARLWRH